MGVPSEAPSSLSQRTYSHQSCNGDIYIQDHFKGLLFSLPLPQKKKNKKLCASPDGVGVKSYLRIQHQHPLRGGSCGFPRTWPSTEKGWPPSQHRSLHPARWALTPARRQPGTELTVLGRSPPPCTPLRRPSGSSCRHTRCPICHCGRLQLCRSRNLSRSPAWYGSHLERVPL